MAIRGKRFNVVMYFQDRSDSKVGQLIEILRYAGVIIKAAEPRELNNGGLEHAIVIRCPVGIPNQEVWAKSQADRIKSFGIDAEPVEIKI